MVAVDVERRVDEVEGVVGVVVEACKKSIHFFPRIWTVEHTPIYYVCGFCLFCLPLSSMAVAC